MLPVCWPRLILPMRGSSSRSNGWEGFVTLGTVFLVVTGGEALYADVGHFGIKPIRAFLVCRGVSSPSIELFRSRVAASAARPVGCRASVLSFESRLGAVPHHCSGDDRRDHRFASGDYRILLIDAASNSARLLPPTPHRAHVVRKNRANLHSRGQLGADDLEHRARVGIPLVQQSGVCLRTGDHHHDGDHDILVLYAGHQSVEMASRLGSPARGIFPWVLMATWQDGRRLLAERRANHHPGRPDREVRTCRPADRVVEIGAAKRTC